MALITYRQYMNANGLNESYISTDKIKKYMDTIYKYVKSKLGELYFENTDDQVKKKSGTLLFGRAFWIADTSTRVRFNFMQEQLAVNATAKSFSDFRIHSVDIFDTFTPLYTVKLNDLNVNTDYTMVQALPLIVKMIKDPSKYLNKWVSIKEARKPLGDDVKLDRLNAELLDIEDRAKARSARKGPDGKPLAPTELMTKRMNAIKAEIQELQLKLERAESEKDVSGLVEKYETIADGISDEEYIQSLFDDIDTFVDLVAQGAINSLIVVGGPGIGKTYGIDKRLRDFGLSILDIKKPDSWYDAVVISGGDISPSTLYKQLYTHNNKLIVFDDLDSMFKDRVMLNILKGALNDGVRRVSWMSANTFDATGKDQDEIDELLKSGKFPNTFNFEGQIIFISNLSSSEFKSNNDLKAIFTRVQFVDVDLSSSQVELRIKMVLPYMAKDLKASMEVCEEVFEYIKEMSAKYTGDVEFSLRQMKSAINLRMSGKPDWKRLILRGLGKN